LTVQSISFRVPQRAAIGNNRRVPATAPQVATIVVLGVVIASLVISVAMLVLRGDGGAHDQIGDGGLLGPPTPLQAPPAESEGERIEEIRQMLTARSERRRRQGLEPIDVEAELDALLQAERASAHHDSQLVEEVRQLVVARNARRERRGEAPLDVDAEVERTLAEFDS